MFSCFIHSLFISGPPLVSLLEKLSNPLTCLAAFSIDVPPSIQRTVFIASALLDEVVLSFVVIVNALPIRDLFALVLGGKGASFFANDAFIMIVLVEFFLECLFSPVGVLLVFAVDIVDAFDCILVAGGNMYLLEGSFLFALVLSVIELDQLLLELARLFLFLLALLLLLFVIASVDFLEVFLVLFCVFGLFLVDFAAVGCVFVEGVLDLLLELGAGGQVLFFLSPEEILLVL